MFLSMAEFQFAHNDLIACNSRNLPDFTNAEPPDFTSAEPPYFIETEQPYFIGC